MKIFEMIRRGSILVPLDAPDLEFALMIAFQAIPGMPKDAAKGLAKDLVAGTAGEIHRVQNRVVVAFAASDVVEGTCAVIGVVPEGFTTESTEASSSPESAVILVVVTPRSVVSVRERMLPTLKRFFHEEDWVAPLLSARSVDDVVRVAGFMDLDPHRSLLVEDVVEPIQYRVYPDTPYSEVADLMVRRELHAVPVVGEDYEFLGMITTSEAMDEILSQARAESVGGTSSSGWEERTAREIMTRSVMCVSEDQSLIEAASIMVNRKVEQLPVIRDGEVVGVLTRNEALRWLFPETPVKQDE